MSQNDSLNLAFLNAVYENDSEKTVELLKKGAEINYTSSDNVSALHYTVVNKNVQLLLYLINQGAYVNAQDYNGNTPLALASQYGYDTLMFSLIMADAELLISNGKKEYPLHLAVLSGNPVAVDMLLFYGANPDMKDKDSLCALHYAAYNGLVQISQILIDGGANVHAVDKMQRHAGFYAVMSGSIPILAMLANAGIDLWTKDNKGLSLLEYSIAMGDDELSDSLLGIITASVGEKLNESDVMERIVDYKSLWRKALREDNVFTMKLLRKYALKRPAAPVMGSVWLHTSFTGMDDLFSNYSFIWKEVNYKFSLEAGFGYRVGRRKVLIPISQDSFYQAREMRLNYYLSMSKDFVLWRFHERNNKLELSAGFMVPFTTAGYRGLKTRDKIRATYAPTLALVYYQREGIRLFGAYHYWNYDQLNFSKHKFSMGFAVRLKSYK